MRCLFHIACSLLTSSILSCDDEDSLDGEVPCPATSDAPGDVSIFFPFQNLISLFFHPFFLSPQPGLYTSLLWCGLRPHVVLSPDVTPFTHPSCRVACTLLPTPSTRLSHRVARPLCDTL